MSRSRQLSPWHNFAGLARAGQVCTRCSRNLISSRESRNCSKASSLWLPNARAHMGGSTSCCTSIHVRSWEDEQGEHAHCEIVNIQSLSRKRLGRKAWIERESTQVRD